MTVVGFEMVCVGLGIPSRALAHHCDFDSTFWIALMGFLE
jgi:hypothetical protein